ncbi:hypothetical protein GCM10027418_24710 [Mariniluteicoccus endophyticus]
MILRTRTLVALLLGLSLVVTSCTGGADRPPPPPGTDGLVASDWWAARQKDYLHRVTERVDPTSLDSIVAALARQQAEPAYAFDPRRVTEAGLRPVLDKIDGHRDTSDFDQMRLWLAWHAGRDRLDPATRAALERRILDYRYWYTDPLPDGVVDHKWFWSENHRIIAHTLEYLAGRELPDATFTITAEPGRVHAQRGRERIIRWLDEKARWGMSEWQSDVYYAEDLQPLLMLAEHAEPAIADRAMAMLDMLALDLAVNQLDGNLGVSHGRSYMKNKARASTQGVHDLLHLAYGTSPEGYSDRTDFAAVLLASATRYRIPEAIRRVAVDPAPFTGRQRTGVPIDPQEPFGLAVPPPGTSYTDPEALEFWWDRGAMTAWQVVPLSMRAIEEHRLWTTDLFAPLARVIGPERKLDPRAAQYAAYALGCQVNQGLLARADTVVHRRADAMLSSVQDYRPGCFGRQYHAWQATLGSDAVVFTTHPGTADTGTWADGDLYWNGAVTMPRTAQSNGALIAIYSPAYRGGTGEDANFLPMTHAYFPTERFDEVRQHGHWVFGRKGDGYVALWSHRDAQFAEPGPNPAGLGSRYDLVADGGPDNVWISEVGDRARWGSFDAFVDAHRAARVEVAAAPPVGKDASPGFSVRYESPTEKEMRFGTVDGFSVDGRVVDQHPAGRMANPYATVAEADPVWTVAGGDLRWRFDLATGRRGPA